jgi:hypothetical protein
MSKSTLGSTARTAEDLIARLEELSALRDGHCDGHGSAIRSECVNEARNFINRYPIIQSKISIYPMMNGGIDIEFEVNNWDVTISIRPDKIINVNGVKINGPDDFFETFPFGDKNFHAKMIRIIK